MHDTFILHANFTETIKVVDMLRKKLISSNSHLLKSHILYVHTGIASIRRFQCVPTKYVTEK